MRVAVIGGGISGLAAAVFLEDEDVLVLEAGTEPGGNVRSLVEDGRTIDLGPTGWLDNEPAMQRLVERVGLADRTVPAHFGTRWIYANGAMHAAPLGPLALARSELLPLGAKLRLLAEPLLPRGGGPDQTVDEFACRRLGPAVAERMVGPMVAGIHAARPDQVSLEAAFPRMAELEREHRSLFLAMLKLGRGGAPSGHLQTLEGGVGALTRVLAERLGDRLATDVTVESIRRTGSRWAVSASSGDVEADAVVLACPAFAQASIVRALDPAAAAALEAIPYSPVAVVVTAWPEHAFPRHPEGFGVLAVPSEGLGVLGTLFTSSIFPGQSRPGEVLLRTMIGGAVEPEAVEEDDQQLLGRAVRALERFLGAPTAEPTLVRVLRHPRGIPLYAPGHRERVAAVREAEARHPGLYFIGNHLDGVGVKDCARAAEQVAGRIRRVGEAAAG